MCECERLCCVRARVNIYHVADWLKVEKKVEKIVEKIFRSEGYREILSTLYGYTARSYSQ